MPRAKKTSSGVPGQPVQAIRGQEYGKGVEQEALQRAMPAPAEPGVAVLTSPSETSESEPQRPPVDIAALQQTLSGMGGILKRPDDRPDVPFTSSLTDPGAPLRMGIVSPVNRTGELMRELSRRTGDSMFADLAAKAGY